MADMSLQNYQALFKSLSGRYIVFANDDPLFTIVEESETHAEVAMVKREDVIGRPLLEAFPDTSDRYLKTGVSDLVESIRRVVSTGKPDSMPDLRYDLKDQHGVMKAKYWGVTHYPVFSEAGELLYVFQATEDITDARRLAEAQRQLDEALSLGKIGAWSWDIASDVVVADRNLAAMFGISRDKAAAGLPIPVFLESIHRSDRGRVGKLIQKSIKTGEPYETEYRTISTDGSVRWVIARGKVEYDYDGKPSSFPGSLVDITERKQAEQNLTFLAQASVALSSSLEYRKTLNTIAKLLVPNIADWATVHMLNDKNMLEQVAVAHVDPSKVKWAKELNKQRGPIPLDDPTNGTALVVRECTAQIFPVITDAMIEASTPDAKERELLRGLGLSSAITVPIIVNGKATGAVSLISAELRRHYTDSDFEMAKELASRISFAIANAQLYNEAQKEIEHRRRLEEQLREINNTLEARVLERTEQLNQANVSLRRSNEELENFAYVASHDLQEPLRKIQAFGDLLDEEYADKLGEGRDYLTRMKKAAGRMSVLIEDLLAFSRVTTKAKDPVEVDLNTVVNEVVDDLQIRVERCEGVVEVGDLPTILADPLQMRQLFQNLIGNALKFHREDVAPVVKVSAGLEQDGGTGQQMIRLEVADNGIGFEEKYLDRIFSVFQRLHGRDAYEGTGIGLAVCRKIVERHGGCITASSVPGEGSKFTIMLPLENKELSI
ncbi:PAS domain-containing protein [Candidatus Saccharibacteria bacterium]|nr:PAS domain-containing protein [Candidatus Saccharibacteria bacterium]